MTNGERLARRMAQRDINAKELSEKADLPEGVISRLLSDKRLPSLRTAVALEKVLGIPPRLWLQ